MRVVPLTSSDLITALSRPEAYSFAVDRVELMQTPISMIFFAGQRVYKVKKAVNLGFLDYSTTELRRHFCEEEVRLNRRLAPHVYLGVQPITLEREGCVKVDGAGEIVDYAVEMVRLPEHRMLNRMLDRGEVDNHLLNDLATLLVRFHKDCATGIGVDEHAAPNELCRQVAENLQELAVLIEATPTREASQRIISYMQSELKSFINQNESLLDRRIHQGRVREGHGDLHSGNICITDSGIIIYDCIEFSRRFRCRDVACELAFLAMDLDLQGFRAFSRYLIKRYADLTRDDEIESLMRLYKPHLALVRAKVAELRRKDHQLNDVDRHAARREAFCYLHLGAGYLLGPALIIMCGLPGTGKSRVARAIERPLAAVVLQSDAIRKQLAGIDPSDHVSGPQRNIYHAEFTRRTYAAMRERAQAVLRGTVNQASGGVVIVDATMPHPTSRADFLNLARTEGVPAVVVYTKAPAKVIHQRLAKRPREAHEVSDADWRVYANARHSFDVPREIPRSMRLTISPATDPDEATTILLDILIAQRTTAR